jgi:hypothetical protein
MQLCLLCVAIRAWVSRSELLAQTWRPQRWRVKPQVLPPTAAQEDPSSRPVLALRLQRVPAVPVVVPVTAAREASRQQVALRGRAPVA